MPLPERLAGGGQTQGQQVPAHHFGPGFEREHSAVFRQAGIEGQGFERQPLQPPPGAHMRLDFLFRRLAQAAVEAGRPRCGDERMRLRLHAQIDVDAVAAHEAAGRMYQHMMANPRSFGVERRQHPHRATVLRMAAAAPERCGVAQVEAGSPAGAGRSRLLRGRMHGGMHGGMRRGRLGGHGRWLRADSARGLLEAVDTGEASAGWNVARVAT